MLTRRLWSKSPSLSARWFRSPQHGRAFSALTPDGKEALVSRLLTAKESSGLSFDEIAAKLGLTNLNAAQLFFNQAQLKDATAEKLAALIPGIAKEDLKLMKMAPFRSFDPAIVQEPTVYRLNEAVFHYGQAVKAIVNERCGDGIMSAIDLYSRIDTVTGVHGEQRVVITLSGKFLPYIEQHADQDMSVLPKTVKVQSTPSKKKK
ncbi:cyanate lyase C-terminal domain-containing protein [Chytriomyces sp. MP71]|nr:cyanate lyase C-terminal domain-containing protein [Chytriomyces sp. MP71]